MGNPDKRAALEGELADAQQHQAEAAKFMDHNAAHIADLKSQLGVVDDDDYQLSLVNSAGRRQSVNAKGSSPAVAAQVAMRKMPGWTVEHEKTVKLADLQDVAEVPEVVPDVPPVSGDPQAVQTPQAAPPMVDPPADDAPPADEPPPDVHQN